MQKRIKEKVVSHWLITQWLIVEANLSIAKLSSKTKSRKNQTQPCLSPVQAMPLLLIAQLLNTVMKSSAGKPSFNCQPTKYCYNKS